MTIPKKKLKKIYTISDIHRTYYSVEQRGLARLHPIQKMLVLDDMIAWAEKEQRKITKENANDLIYSNYQVTL
jgi:hypothetical protein